MSISLGEKLREIRNSRGLGLRDVAEAIKISFSNLSMIERNQRPNLSMNLVKRLALFYDISLESLLENEFPSPSVNKNRKNVISEDAFIKTAKAFHNYLNNNMEGLQERPSPNHLWGITENGKAKISLIQTAELIQFKSNTPLKKHVGILNSLWNTPLVSLEKIEDSLDSPYNIYLTFWITPLGSKANIYRKIYLHLCDSSTVSYKIYDKDIRQYFKQSKDVSLIL